MSRVHSIAQMGGAAQGQGTPGTPGNLARTPSFTMLQQDGKGKASLCPQS